MGLTIHIQGRLKNPGLVHELSEELAEYAAVLGWKHRRVEGEPLQGISVTAHPDCEPLMLLFDEDGILRSDALYGRDFDDFVSVKTQYAPSETHVTICNLLRHLKERYFWSMEVYDEGGYWETNERAELEKRHHHLARVISRMGDALENLQCSEEPSSNDLAEYIVHAASHVFDTMEDESSSLLDQVNGPQPPYDWKEREEWDMDRWMDFWRRWASQPLPRLATRW